MGNPNLKSGQVEDKGDAYIGEVVTREGSLVDQVKIDKATGRVYARYGLQAPMMQGRYGSGSQSGWNYCPYCGSPLGEKGGYGMGGAMPHHRAQSAMMGPDHGTHHANWRGTEPMAAETAKEIVEDYLAAGRNPNLKIGKITEKSSDFEVKIVTKKKEDLVNVLLVNKNTGDIRSVY